MEKQRIFVDMDGVLAVFKAGAKLETLYEKGFFLNLKPQENIVSMIKDLQNDPNYEVFVLSAYFTDSDYAKVEKIQWLSKYLPEMDREHILLCACGEDKSKYVPDSIRSSDILLDDYTPNLINWKNVGGIAIKVMNGINGTKGTWKGAKLDLIKPFSYPSCDEYAETLKNNFYKLINALNACPDLFEHIDKVMIESKIFTK